MGRAAARLLLEHITRPADAEVEVEVEQIVFQPELVVRASTDGL